MKILMISPYIPYPPITGGKVRVLNFLNHLKKDHQVILLCLLKNEKELADVPQIKKYCYKVVPVLRRKAWSLKNLFRTLFSGYSFLTVVNNFSHDTEEAIKKIILEEKPDLIHLETFYMAQSLLAVRDCIKVPIVLSKVDVEAQVYFRHAQVSKNPLIKLVGFWDATKMLNYETYVCQFFDQITCASNIDRQLLEKELKKRSLKLKKPIEIIPNGVNCRHFATENIGKTAYPTIVFVGNFRYFANSDAVFYFVEKIWPQVKKEFPATKLYIVGPLLTGGIQQTLSHNIARFASGDIIITGYVPEKNKLDCLSSSWVSVAPLRIGSGTKLKILEAMSMSLPVVATEVGIEGIEAENGKEVFVENKPKEFARKITLLLNDRKEREKMGRLARELVLEKYDWPKIAHKLEKIYLELGYKK